MDTQLDRPNGPTRSERSLDQQKHVLQEALGIFVQRSNIRGDLWAQFNSEDSLHHCRSKIARVEAIIKGLDVGRFAGDVGTAKAEAVDDLLDLINYAAFTVRHLTGEKPIPMVD